MNDSHEKEVLVVGGGIGGITAALELASCGVHVTMLEEGPSIGGRMIQLDKTFPTLDCSTCTLSPKMVEVALNQKIELLSWAKPMAVKKNETGFAVTILKKTRYVDIKKCTACGTCFPGCPVVMKSEFNLGIGFRKAVYIPFPQSIPNKATIDKREDRPCKAACMDTCPIHTNVLGYLKHISEGRFKDAYLLIRATNPLPSTCGRICFAPCEKECNRGQIDDPLAIRALKRFATDEFNIDELEVPQITKTNRKVAIIGAGPAGLAAAHDLALEGHDVTIFESLPEPGGMIRYAIPDYRLPKELVKKEIEYIQKLGIDIKCNTQITKDSFKELRKNYEAVFISVGASKSRKLGVENEDAKGIIGGIDFLRNVNSGEPVKIGKTIFVIGGGNVAVDVALTAKKCGAAEVHMVSLEKKEEMPAHESEIEQAIAEGVIIHNSLGPRKFKESNGNVTGMEFKACTSVFDADGKFNPIYDNTCIEGFDADMVIVAIGQAIDTEFLKSTEQIELFNDGRIKNDPRTYETSMKGVFSGGDVVTGPSYVINAIAAGKRVALSISRYLKGESLLTEVESLGPKIPERLNEDEITELKERFGEAKRISIPELPLTERTGNFKEVATGYTAEEAMKEASRCLAGQIQGCIQCGECQRRCAIGAVDYKIKDEIVEMQFDSIVLAPGFDLYDPTEKGEYGYGSKEGVIMGMEFERMCSVTGPTGGDILFKGKTPKRFFFIQCVGSRDRQTGARFCSRVCCMYTAKHASIVRDRIKDAEIYVSYIDVRAYGKNYEEFYKSTQENGIFYIRGIPGEVTKTENGLLVRVEDMLSGEMRDIEVDLVILATGVRPRKETEELCGLMSVERDEYGFIKTDSINPSKTNADGIFVCGMASGPKDVPDTVASGGEAAARCMEYINQ